MRNALVVAAGLAAVALRATAGDPAEVVVAGPLSPSDGLTLAGRVVGGREPVQVDVWRYEFEDTGRWYHRTEAIALKVAPGGRFRITGLVPGRYECEFGDQKYWFAGPSPNVDLVRDVADRVLTVPSACRLTGHVKAAFPGRKSSVRVSLGYFDVLVQADGSFETPDVPPGDYRARIRESWRANTAFPPFESIERAIPVHLGGGATSIDVALTPDVPIALTVRSSRAGETFEGRYGADSGLVQWERGWFRALADASGPAGMQHTHPAMLHGAAAWSNVEMTMPVDGLCAGRHLLRLTALGFAPWERGVDVAPDTRVHAEMTPLPGWFIAVEGLPEVARVELRPMRGEWRELASCDRRMTDMGADYQPSIVEFLAPGRYEWRADSLDGVPTESAWIDVTDDRRTLTLKPSFAAGRTLRGTLRSAGGRALSGVRIRFAVREGDAWRLVPSKDTPTAGPMGAFETRGLGAGHWRAQLDAAGEVVLGEFDVGKADVSRAFRFVPR